MKDRLKKKRYKRNLMVFARKLPAVFQTNRARRIWVNLVATEWVKERKKCRSVPKENTSP